MAWCLVYLHVRFFSQFEGVGPPCQDARKKLEKYMVGRVFNPTPPSCGQLAHTIAYTLCPSKDIMLESGSLHEQLPHSLRYISPLQRQIGSQKLVYQSLQQAY